MSDTYTTTTLTTTTWTGESMSDLLYVERIIATVTRKLQAMAGETKDVEVAARYFEVGRDFGPHFLRWAAAHEASEITRAARGESLTSPVQRHCEDIPLFANLNKTDEVARTQHTLEPLPPVCIEALVYVNSTIPQSNAEYIERNRHIAAKTAAFKKAFLAQNQQQLGTLGAEQKHAAQSYIEWRGAQQYDPNLSPPSDLLQPLPMGWDGTPSNSLWKKALRKLGL